MMGFILKIWIWVTFLRNKEPLPTESKTMHPKMTYEIMSGAFIWEDEGLWEIRNHHLANAFKYVIKHRMNLIVGPNNDNEYLRSKRFDKAIYNMAKRHFPNWVGFDISRCSYNPELKDRIRRIKKAEDWKLEKLLNDE